ncbi:Pentatricopeptide repeat [Parasponia andersonii]|uniref:Pentatricopeptide repeat n=1 Tax=Parasponia andersonii TaxID=3476 RepID=A0A2P5A6U8_PARAD|nr:Pentatricopeptide repeat [Parasponia andersonii]
MFNDLDAKSLVLWNAMLGGYAQNGYAFEVKNLFSNIKEYGFQPDDLTYTSILSACACLEFLELNCQLHLVITKNKFALNLLDGNVLTYMYAKLEALMDARKQFELITNRDKVSWNSIIVGYVQEKDKVKDFNIFQRMNSEGMMPDEVPLARLLSDCTNMQGLNQKKQVHYLSIKSGLEISLYVGSS